MAKIKSSSVKVCNAKRLFHLYNLGIPVPDKFLMCVKMLDVLFEIDVSSTKTERNNFFSSTYTYYNKRGRMIFTLKECSVVGYFDMVAEVYLCTMSEQIVTFICTILDIDDYGGADILVGLVLKKKGYDYPKFEITDSRRY